MGRLRDPGFVFNVGAGGAAVRDIQFDERDIWLTPKQRAALARAPKLPREKQWWTVPAKYRAAERIAVEEREASIARAKLASLPSAHNNIYDAQRHRRWSERMVREIDPLTAALAGYGHEAANLAGWAPEAAVSRLPWRGPAKDGPGLTAGQMRDEVLMDLHNNKAGRDAANGRAPGALRTLPPKVQVYR